MRVEESINKIKRLESVVSDINFNIKDYGAIGDGITNDTVAFQNVSIAINANGGGTLIIPKGTYLVGKQNYTPTGTFAYEGEPILTLYKGNSIVIKGNNSIIKLIPNMRIGHFNQATGLPLLLASEENANTKNSFVNNIINIGGYKNVEIENLELDGQSQTYNNDGTVKTEYTKGVLALMNPNGTYKSNELGAHGLQLINIDSLKISNCEIHHFGVDGIYMGNQMSDKTTTFGYKDTPVTLLNVNCHHNGRQGLSWAGGKGLTAISCKFNYTGKAGILYEPGAGVDVESNEGRIEDGLFLNCEFADNHIGVLSVGANRSLRFDKCRIFGTVGQSIRIFTPRTRFNDCFISGEIEDTYFANNEDDKTYFTGCTISGETGYYDRPIFGSYLFAELNTLSVPNYISNPIFDRCKFITGDKGLFNTSGSAITTIRNCHIIKNNAYGALLNCKFEGNNIVEDSGNIVFTGSTNNGRIKYNSTIIEHELCNSNSIWQSRFKKYYYKGVNLISLPNLPCSFIISCYQSGTTKFLTAIGTKTAKDVIHTLLVTGSSGLTIGDNNGTGTQIINGFSVVADAQIQVDVCSIL